MRILACLLAGAFALATPRAALALGEVIRDVLIRDNARTEEETVRSIAGVTIGETLEINTLEMVRERLNTSGLFADVDVYWKPYRDGVRIIIVVRDKFPWAPVPTFSYAPGNISGGLLIAHGNLFGRGKRGIIGGRLSTADSMAIVAYQDPALFGSWIFLQFGGIMQDQTIPEYANTNLALPHPVRSTSVRSYGFAAKLGIAWFRRVKTAVGWIIDRYDLRETETHQRFYPELAVPLPYPTIGGERAVAIAELTFDFRAREHSVMWGNALSFSVDHGHPRWGGEREYWKARASYEHGFRFLRKHNLIFKVGSWVGKDLPFWAENSAGGGSLRGFLHRQLAGDTQVSSTVEYHFPLFSVSKLDVRGVMFNDATAIYFRELPAVDDTGQNYREREDGRNFLPPAYLQGGFDRHRDVRTSVGVGLRFFLRSVAVPLVGFDAGYGFGEETVRVLLIVGA